MQSDLPDVKIPFEQDLNEKCNPDWVKLLDKQCNTITIKSMIFIDKGHVVGHIVHNTDALPYGAICPVQSLTVPTTHTFGVMNTPIRIPVTNESFNTPTTVRNVTPNLFWVNVNGFFIHSLVDTGSEYSSIREDTLATFNIQATPLADSEINYSLGIAGKVPVLGTVVLNVKFLDIDLKEHLFKVIPKINDETDKIVLGHDFLVQKEIIYCGDRRILRGYDSEFHMWTYQSKLNSVTRIWSEIKCNIKNKFILKPGNVAVVSVDLNMPASLSEPEPSYYIENFSYGTEVNLIRPLNTQDMPYEHLSKKDLRYYTSFPENYYIINLDNPHFELDNQSSYSLYYKCNATVGKAYNIRTIHMNVPVVDPNYKNKYLTVKDEGTYDLHPQIECLLQQNVENRVVNKNNLIHNIDNNTVLNNQTSTENSLYDCDGELKINIEGDDAAINNRDLIADDPLLSDFNLPDEYNLKDPDEWTKESLKESVKIGDCPDGIAESLVDLLWTYKDTVSNSTTVEPSSLPEVHFIAKNDQIMYTPQYKFGAGTSAEIEQIVQDLFKANIIERTNSFFNNPIHLVRKKDGSGRICIDMRKVNTVLQTPVPSPLPSVEDVMSELHGMKVYSSLDLLSGFFQINLSPDSRKYTAFTTTHRYQYVRLPFGCSASPIEFTRLLNIALEDMLVPIQLSGDSVPRIHCKIYVDDLFLFSATHADHLQLLEMLFKLLSKNNLKLKLEKCNFVDKEVTFLGFKFTGTHVEKEKKYIQKVIDLPKPTTIKEVMRLLGSCVYIHRFIKSYATIARPLTRLATTCKKKMRGTVEWTPEMEEAYKKLKDYVAEEVKLVYPDYSAGAKKLVIATDASTVGTGGVLKQMQNGEECIIAFTSSTFNRTQLNYTTTELEILAIKAAIRAFHPFIAGRKFAVYTDHAPLAHLVSMRPFNGRIARTLEFLSNYDFEIVWIQGKENTWPDMLSRTCNWNEEQKNLLALNTIENYTYLPDTSNIVTPEYELEDSMLVALVQGALNLGLSCVGKDDKNKAMQLRLELVDEIEKHQDKYNFVTPSDWKSYRRPYCPLTLVFIQAFANLKGIDVIMYFGLDTPIVFKTEKENVQNRKIFIQSVCNRRFYLLKFKNPQVEVDVKLAIINAQIPYTTIDQIVNERDDPTVDTVDPLAYLNLANSDFSLNTNDFVEERTQHIQTIKHNLKEIRNMNMEDKIRPTLPKTVSYLEHTKAYDQEMNGQFREVHPEGYGSWYTRCCSHPYTTDCFVPLSCGDLRFCGNLDTGSSCSVLSLDVAEKLFKANKLTKLYDTQIHLVCAGGIAKDIRTRIVSADISMGTARLRGVKFILLPKEMMFSCAIIGNEVLSLKGLQLDFGSRVVQYNETIVVELARLRHPRFYTHRHLPPVENNMVLPITPEPYIQLEPNSTAEMINDIYYKMSQNVDETPQLSIEYFLSELDLLELQNSTKEIRRIRRIMSYPNFKFPPYLSQYNKIKNNLLIQDNIVYYKKAPYDQVPLLPTNCIITMALRIHDKYSHCGRDKLVDWVRTIAYHINLSELLGRICSTCPTCLLKNHTL
ncbi:unnamed protein product [Rotaria socialis]|uniref:RNA-directed DNA polymerase n=1 Tax=Rotaria socialis TaxID=392032 RepID=A0A818I733_9BILA|nr:unnamed protein product [Rotaria socialis]CAF4842867.1 unnamed protein product [Rotaria socialis]